MDTTTLIAMIARHGAGTIAGMLVAHGFGTSSQTEQIAGALTLLLTVAWSWWQKNGQAETLAAIAKAQGMVKPNASKADAVEAAKKAAGAAVILLALAFGIHDARAQTRKLITPLRTDSFSDVNVTAGSVKGVAKLGDVIGKVKQFTVDDLTAAAADADAQSPPDPAGECWRVLIPVVQTQTSLLPQGLGLAQAIQKARDLQRKVNAGVSDDVKSKCAIVLWDAEAALLKLGINIAPIPKLPGLPF